MNERTGASQWEFPVGQEEEPKPPLPPTAVSGDPSQLSADATGGIAGGSSAD